MADLDLDTGTPFLVPVGLRLDDDEDDDVRRIGPHLFQALDRAAARQLGYLDLPRSLAGAEATIRAEGDDPAAALPALVRDDLVIVLGRGDVADREALAGYRLYRADEDLRLVVLDSGRPSWRSRHALLRQDGTQLEISGACARAVQQAERGGSLPAVLRQIDRAKDVPPGFALQELYRSLPHLIRTGCAYLGHPGIRRTGRPS